jgi:hypothetical protein
MNALGGAAFRPALLSLVYSFFSSTKPGRGVNTDYASTWGVIRFAEAYDVSICEGTATTTGTESAWSDHYPVWAEFYVYRDED